ncbi:hypothetical protein RHS02_09097, partial [Rhizoctonia solani]
MPPVSRRARSSLKGKGKQKLDSKLPYSVPVPNSGTSLGRSTRQEWTWQEKLNYFRSLPPVLCPASPPPLFSALDTVEEARRRSRERIERMTRRLENLPLYQARNLIHLVSTELKGPFSPGCKHWGAHIPKAKPISEKQLMVIATPIEAPSPYAAPRPIGALQVDIGGSMRPSTPNIPGPSSTVITGPPTPFTPPSATIAPIELLPSKASAGRPIVPIDYDPPSPARSPTPTPSLPPSRMGSQRPSATPVPASQRAFLSNLAQASRASSVLSRRTRPRPSRGLKIMSSTNQQVLDRALSQYRPESRDQSPLSRFSQRQINGATPRMNQLPEVQRVALENLKSPSRQESADTYNYNTQFDIERNIQAIGKFMESGTEN